MKGEEDAISREAENARIVIGRADPPVHPVSGSRRDRPLFTPSSLENCNQKMLARLSAGALKKAANLGASRSSTLLTFSRSAKVCTSLEVLPDLVTKRVDRSDLPLLIPHLPPGLRYVQSFKAILQLFRRILQSLLNSRATLASVSLFTAGSIAWYTHLYGTLPFLGEVHAGHLSDEGLHPTAYPWSHGGILDTFDHARYALANFL